MQSPSPIALLGKRRPSQMLALEPRYLFDAAAVATVADTTSDTGNNDSGSGGSSDASAATASQDSTQENAAEFLTQVNAITSEADLAPDSQSFFVPENATEGSRAGFIATNSETGEFSYTVTGGTGETAFAVNPNTGEIIVTDSSQLNFEDFNGEAKLTIDVLITKELGGGNSEQEQVEATVFIGDVNEPPVVEPIENQTATVGETLTVQIVAHDEDGDQIFYELKDAPAGASIDANGLFTWTPTPEQESEASTTINIYVSDGPLGSSTTTTVDFDFEIERVNPINDTNNGDPSRGPSAIGGPASSDFVSDQLVDSSTTGEIVGETVAKESSVSETRTAVDLLLLEIAETEEHGLEEIALVETEIEQVQTLIAEGNDPTQLTPATAAGFSKQLMTEAQSQEAETAEILAIMEEATALLGCNR